MTNAENWIKTQERRDNIIKGRADLRAVSRAEYLKEYHARPENRAKRSEHNKVKYTELALYIESFKKKCVICGYSKCKDALDFHHVVPNDKYKTLKQIRNKKDIDTEIAKCIVVCSNCHREIHSSKTHE